jgi:hypothetical protein
MFGRYSTRWLDYTTHSFDVPRWTKPGFSVAYFSDSHLTDTNAVNVTREAVEYAIAQKPRMLLFGGDFVESSSEGSVGRIQEAFSPVKGCGIPAFAVLGNHDYAAFHPEHVLKAGRDAGFDVLRNEFAEVDGVTIFGLDCMSFGRTDVGKLAEIDARQDVITMLHEPDGVDRLPDFPSIMLAGHSHGGQICLPGGIPVTTPFGARKYPVGYYPDAKVPLFVSRGLGETGVRLRLFCRPEVSILTLNPGGASA